ncbi:MAG: phospholipid carrier-dependent glycosyltransferase [Candidatus Omnitrophota bacterium]
MAFIPGNCSATKRDKRLNTQTISYKKSFFILAAAIFLLGSYLRFYHITENQFIYYDEGMWLVQNHELVRLMEHSRHQGLDIQGKLLNIAFHLSLRTGKALWSLISYLRGFFVGAEGYYFTRILSAVFGIFTIVLCSFFSKRFYKSTATGILAMILLSILPSHVYYSRLALQESFSCFFFLAGVYLYLFPVKISFRTFMSSICFSIVYFVNYRMILVPFFLMFCEFYMSFSENRKPDLRKWIYHSLLFFMIVFGVGALDHGANTYVTFGWMFHQSHLARGTFDPVNLFSYPYYVFKLEGIFFGLLFFGNVYLIIRKKRKEVFPFLFVLLFMIIFSLPQEKGVRYLTCAMPFMVMAVAHLINDIAVNMSHRCGRVALGFICFLLIAGQILESFHISRFRNDYQTSVVEIKQMNPQAKFVSTQSLVQKMFAGDYEDVVEFKYGLPYLLSLYSQGYRYLIVGPQAYISFTEDHKRFSPPLKGYMQFFRNNVPPVKTYNHFNERLLARFVLEHNENLKQSLAFLKQSREENFQKLNVYDIRLCIAYIKKGVELNHLKDVQAVLSSQ